MWRCIPDTCRQLKFTIELQRAGSVEEEWAPVEYYAGAPFLQQALGRSSLRRRLLVVEANLADFNESILKRMFLLSRSNLI